MITALHTISVCQWLASLVPLLGWRWLLRWRADSPYLLSFARLPGVISHEFMHWAIAAIFCASPQAPVLAPKTNNTGFTLGSVAFIAKPISAFFVATAPILLIIPAISLVWYLLHSPCYAISRIWQSYLAWVLLEEMWPSKTDWQIAYEYPIGGVLFAAVLALAWAAYQ